MIEHNIILDAYKKGPEAVITLFEETFRKLEMRIQELENRSKKTLQIAISLLPQAVYANQLHGVCVNRLIVKQVANLAIKDTLFIWQRLLIIL